MLDKILDKEGRRFWMGIAIIWIYLFHLVIFSRSDIGGGMLWTAFCYIFETGYIGVDIFLFLSAYGLCHSFNKNTLFQFYANRLKRLFPVYLVFLVILLSLFFRGMSLQEKVRMILLQSTGLSIVETFNCNLEWYTPSLIVVYALFPLLYKLSNWIYKKNGLMLYATLFIIAVVSYKFGVVIYENFARRFAIIIVGILTYFFLRDKRNNQLLLLYSLLVVFSFVVKDLSVKFSLCLPMALVGLNYPPPKIIEWSVGKIGKFSFEIYLAQVIATKYFMPTPAITNIYVDMFVATLITAALAAVLATTQRLTQRAFAQ